MISYVDKMAILDFCFSFVCDYFILPIIAEHQLDTFRVGLYLGIFTVLCFGAAIAGKPCLGPVCTIIIQSILCYAHFG